MPLTCKKTTIVHHLNKMMKQNAMQNLNLSIKSVTYKLYSQITENQNTLSEQGIQTPKSGHANSSALTYLTLTFYSHFLLTN